MLTGYLDMLRTKGNVGASGTSGTNLQGAHKGESRDKQIVKLMLYELTRTNKQTES